MTWVAVSASVIRSDAIDRIAGKPEPADGETEDDGLIEDDGLRLALGDVDEDGDWLRLTLGLSEALELLEGDTDADGETDGEALLLGLVLALGETDGLVDEDGDTEALGLDAWM